jgi:hypothetical protein
MTSKYGARAIHYEFLQLYCFSECTGIISVDPTHLRQRRGIVGVINPYRIPQSISPITSLHPILQVFNMSSQTNLIRDIYFKVKLILCEKLPPHENVREYHGYRIDF